MKTVLVTGGAGFIGAHFVRYMTKKYPQWSFVTVDSFTYAADKRFLDTLGEVKNHRLIVADITDASLMKQVFAQNDFDMVVHFAAQTHVDNSISGPDVFVHTNVYGTQCLLSAAKNAWQTGTDQNGYPVYKEGALFLHISTDEVYGDIESGSVDETAPLKPSSPYAASKLASDMLVQSFEKTYRFPAIITRSSNNFGPHQFPEKLIPLMIGKALKSEPLPVYGDGLQKRDWIYVLDNVKALEKIMISGEIGQVYNIGTGIRKTNLEVVRLILKQLEKPDSLISYVQDRLEHDRRYAVDTARVRKLGWQPEHEFEEALEKTVIWYIERQ